MNIVITLPKYLCQEIIAGRKKIEIRKNFPKKFRLLVDKVYVIQKGTHNIVCSFTIQTIEVHSNPYFLWNVAEDLICVSWDWFYKYVEKSSCFYAWVIGSVTTYHSILDARLFLGIYKNPQSFCYVSQA